MNNPHRLASGYDTAHLEALQDAFFDDASKMAAKYGISLERALFDGYLENLNIAVHDYSEQKAFLKECVKMGMELKGEYEWKIKGLRIDSGRIKNSKNISDGIKLGLIKELDAFAESEKKNGRMVDDVLLMMIKNYLQDKDVHFPEGWYKSVEEYLLDAVEFTYLDMTREGAAQSLAVCFLNSSRTLTISEGAFIYDLLHYCGYVDEEQWEDKNLEIYYEKCKYDMVKSFFKG